ncbi:hypothetical protein HNP46_003439 [Pseudomonas nitritireducens]|uniref:Uncharacterized protein n=1 Tax=Pseudomonas nitroreducens TaxID=46680 RepID=A0A7W7KLL8_PSENT|nr:hypothetical protein [Pseudomonas nitritireducens]MBB4864568.1 hypothetical protein [Pseudomonas nitritireducens]
MQFAIKPTSSDINWIFQKISQMGWAEGTNRISDKSYLRNDHRWQNRNAPMEIGLFSYKVISIGYRRLTIKLQPNEITELFR